MKILQLAIVATLPVFAFPTFADNSGASMSGDVTVDTNRSTGEKLEDAAITTKIKSKLLAESNTPGLAVNVSTKLGVVTLEGTVNTEVQKQNVEKVALDTEGVQKVSNKLIVSTGS